MSNPNQRRRTNPNQQPKKTSKVGLVLSGAALIAVGGVLGVAYSESNKAEKIHAEESAKKTPPKTTSRTTTMVPTTTTTIETTQPPTISIVPETTNPQGKEAIDPRDEKLRQRVALFSGCSVRGIYDEGSSIKLEISTTFNKDSFYARDAARKSDGGIYGSGVAIYQTDKNGALLNQSPIVRTEIGTGGTDYDVEHPTVTLPEREGAYYEVSAITGAAIGDKALVNAVACDVISFKNGQWNIADVPPVSGSRTIS